MFVLEKCRQQKKSILKKLWEKNILKICGKKKHIFFMKKSQ
jgi:hypothetical protein